MRQARLAHSLLMDDYYVETLSCGFCHLFLVSGVSFAHRRRMASQGYFCPSFGAMAIDCVGDSISSFDGIMASVESLETQRSHTRGVGHACNTLRSEERRVGKEC